MNQASKVILEEMKRETELFNKRLNEELLDYYTVLGGNKPISRHLEPNSYSIKYKDFNLAIYSELTQGKYIDLMDPVKMLDHIYIGLALYNKDVPRVLEAYINNLTFSEAQRNYLSSALTEVINLKQKLKKTSEGIEIDQSDQSALNSFKSKLVDYDFLKLPKKEATLL
ncbi:MAG: hypothetical protein EOO47_21050, partial [Flavobacterium sp.]